ncbi:uncharacterized protein LOC124161825 [Ischnura elegans]|uniref:uncharacterized protein LOC124161825 n=1 Tax=Ischnura elegans TaxID=197161 RepID=UPI001ED8BCEC|nr:uncharacterized protein LOC124161825 [Ischnura elegans]
MMATSSGARNCCSAGGGDGVRGRRRRRVASPWRMGARSLASAIAIILLFLNAATLTTGLRNVRINVPEAVRRGGIARLSCNYDLESSPLYSIKWYKDEEEFYRYVPKEAPPTQVFPLSGINVDVSLSNDTDVRLNDVQMGLSGVYKCEVSADAPLFHTDIRSAPMVVVDFPDELPEVSIEKRKFGAGERIRANCTAPPSYPPANLTWFLNGQEVPAHVIILYPVSIYVRPVEEENEAEPKKEEEEKKKEEEEDKKKKGAEGTRKGITTNTKWTIGGKPLSEVRKKPKPKPTSPPLETALLGLDLDLETASEILPHRESGGGPRLLTLRCLASLFGLYRRAAEVHLMAEDSPKIASVVLGSSRKDAGATAAAAAAAHGPSPAHPSLHHSGTAATSVSFFLNYSFLMALVNVFATARVGGWR